MPADPDATPFIGRADELQTFERAVASARAGAPATLLISGDAGIGKTTLVQQAATRLGAALVRGRCLPMGGQVMPLAPLTEIVRHVRRHAPSLLEDDAVSPLRRWLVPGGADGDDVVRHVFEATLSLLGLLGSADAPAMVVFEDLHWADGLTWDLVSFLTASLVEEHVVLVATFRTDEVALDPTFRRRLAQIGRLPGVGRMPLSGLGRDDVAAQVDALLGRPAPPALIEEIARRGEGNPFFTEELVVAHAAGASLPSVLADIVAADLARLDDAARQVVAGLAIIGRPVDHRTLRAVVDLDDGGVEAGLRSAVDARLVVVEGASHRFRHALIAEVVLAELLPVEQQRLHARVAAALGSSGEAERGTDVAGELAFHLDRAGDAEAAFPALLAAADATMAFAPAVALRHLERALELWDRVESSRGLDRRRRMWDAAELASATVGNGRAAEIARAALELGPAPRGEAWGRERLGRYLWAIGDLDGSAAEFALAAELVERDEAERDPMSVAGLAQGELMAGRWRHALELLDLLPQLRFDLLASVMSKRLRGAVLGADGRVDEGVALCREAADESPTAQGRALAQVYLGQVLIERGDGIAGANEMLDIAAEARRMGVDPSFGGYMGALAAELLLRAGRWNEAQVVLDRQDPEGSLVVATIRLLAIRALLEARRGDGVAARALLADAERRNVDGWSRRILDDVTAEVGVLTGDWAGALQAATRGASSELGELRGWRARFAMFAAIAAVEAELDRRARRDTAPADSLELPVWSGDAADGSLMAAAAAHAAAERTRLERCDVVAWDAAVDAWDAAGDMFWAAIARFRLAEAAVAAGEVSRAAASLQAAYRSATQLGACRLIADIEACSKRTRITLAAPPQVIASANVVDRVGLTTREVEVLALVAGGLTNRQIGEALYISEKTASVHVSNIIRKLGVVTRVDAAAAAHRLGLVASSGADAGADAP